LLERKEGGNTLTTRCHCGPPLSGREIPRWRSHAAAAIIAVDAAGYGALFFAIQLESRSPLSSHFGESLLPSWIQRHLPREASQPESEGESEDEGRKPLDDP